MSIYAGDGYTLVRVPTKQGLAVSITKGSELKAAVCAPHVERALEALRFGWECAERRMPIVDVVSGLVVRVLDGSNVMRVHVDDWSTPIARVDADHLQLAARVLSRDPGQTYNPIRRIEVRAGDAYVRHHTRTQSRVAAARDTAFRSIYNRIAEERVVELLTQEQT